MRCLTFYSTHLHGSTPTHMHGEYDAKQLTASRSKKKQTTDATPQCFTSALKLSPSHGQLSKSFSVMFGQPSDHTSDCLATSQHMPYPCLLCQASTCFFQGAFLCLNIQHNFSLNEARTLSQAPGSYSKKNSLLSLRYHQRRFDVS